MKMPTRRCYAPLTLTGSTGALLITSEDCVKQLEVPEPRQRGCKDDPAHPRKFRGARREVGRAGAPSLETPAESKPRDTALKLLLWIRKFGASA